MRLLVFLLPFLLPALAADEDDYCEADYSAGVGVELESPAFYLVSPDCPDEEVYKTRKKVIANKIGENWQLTADTGGGFGKVQAELIFDGTMIKIGSGELAEAGEAAANEIVSGNHLSLLYRFCSINPNFR